VGRKLLSTEVEAAKMQGSLMELQEGWRNFGQTDPQALMAKRFFVSDPNLLELTKGYFNEPLTKILQYIKLAEDGQPDNWPKNTVFELKAAIQAITEKLDVYIRLVPYQFLLSHLIRLGNLTPLQAEKYHRRIKLMIYTDKITSTPKERVVLTSNFWNGLELLLDNAVSMSVQGWMARVMTTEEKRLHTEGLGFSQPKKKWYQHLW